MRLQLKISALILAFMLLCGSAFAEGSAPLVIRLLESGEKIPSMVLPDRKGVEHEIGKPATGPFAIYFWSVFCPNCKEAMPHILDLHSKWKDKGFSVWAVNVDGENFSNAVDAYLADAGLPFTVVSDKLVGDYLVAADPLGVEKTPTLYLVDKDGTVLTRQVIEIDIEAASKVMEKAMQEKK